MTSVQIPPATGVAVRLVEPLSGFDDEVDYTLTGIDPDGVLLAMRSVRDPSLRFVLTPAEHFFTGYRPLVGAAVASAVDAAGDDDLTFLLLLTIDRDLYDATANLRAPIVMARSGGAAVQVVLDDESLSMREPLVRGDAA